MIFLYTSHAIANILSSMTSSGRTYRNIVFRLVPGSRRNASRLAGQAGACRYVWNEILRRSLDARREAEAAGEDPPSVSFFSLGKEFTGLRGEIPWLKEYSFASTRYVLKHQADAWRAFFRGNAKPPRFKSRGGTVPSFAVPQDVRVGNGKILVPKIGWMRIRRKGGNPHPDGVPVRAAIRKSAGRWEAVICFRVAAEDPPDNGVAAGVDMNAGQVAVVDTAGRAEIMRAPDTGRLDAKIRRCQKRMARQRKGSKRRQKTRLRMRRLHRRRANVRSNWQRQASRRLADRAGTVIVERLNVRGMTASARGTIDSPGRNVRQKSGLSRVILNTGWAGLRRKLDCKCGNVAEVSPAYAPQTCSSCGAADRASRLSQSEFKCAACGRADNADLNAARNILASGIGAAARGGEPASAAPANRENVYGKAA